MYEAWENGQTGVYVEYIEQQVAKLEQMVAQQARSLRAMAELLEKRGLVTREDQAAKVR